MSDLRQDFLDGMSCVAATVNVVATDGPAGKAGVTVSAMSSVSADTEKPLLLVCVNDLSAGAAPIIKNGVFTVNILRDDQSFVSDTFAGRYGDKGDAKFECATWEKGATGAPVLEGALASFDCKLVEDKVAGQHHVFFGEVQRVHLAERGRALIYANRSYSTALSLPPSPGKSDTGQASRLAISCLSSFAPLYLPALLARIRDEAPDLRVDVIEGDQAQVAHLVETGEVELGLLYDGQVPSLLECNALSRLEPHVVLSADSSFAQQERIALAELSDQPLILLDQPLSRDYVCGLFTNAGLDPDIAMRSPSFELVRSLVGNGLGYSILVTRPAVDSSYDGKKLAVRPISDATEPICISVARSGDAEMSTPAKRFMEFAHDLFA